MIYGQSIEDVDRSREMAAYEEDVDAGYSGSFEDWELGEDMEVWRVQRAEYLAADENGYKGTFDQWTYGGREKWFKDLGQTPEMTKLEAIGIDALVVLKRLVWEMSGPGELITGELSEDTYEAALKLTEKAGF